MFDQFPTRDAGAALKSHLFESRTYICGLYNKRHRCKKGGLLSYYIPIFLGVQAPFLYVRKGFCKVIEITSSQLITRYTTKFIMLPSPSLRALLLVLAIARASPTPNTAPDYSTFNYLSIAPQTSPDTVANYTAVIPALCSKNTMSWESQI